MNATTDQDENANNFADREFRWHPMLGQWVIISVASSRRPWGGATSQPTRQDSVEHDPECYLCPRVTRSSGQPNPDYRGPMAFENDFPSLAGNDGTVATPEFGTTSFDPFHHAAASAGTCRVLCWNERHDLTLADLKKDDMISVAKLWRDEYRHLRQQAHIANVLIFENKGVEIGVSNLHPHGQVYATPFVTDTALRMRENQAAFVHAKNTEGMNTNNQRLLESLLQHPDYQSSAEHSLLVEEGLWFKTIVPYFARFSYETWVVPKAHVCGIDELSDEQIEELALMYQRQTQRYDIFFQRSSPNITLLHNAPCDDHPDNQWCSFHIVMQPPLREPEKLKFLAGFESGGGNVVNPLTPELAAATLRECSAQLPKNSS